NRDVPQLREHTYELSYNSACQLVGRGQYGEAERKLKATEKLCRDSIEEEDEGDIEDELGIIKVQLAYCLHMQGREKEAQLIYTAALKQKPDDIGLVAIASNNIIAINRDQNVFDSKKKIKSATLEGLEHKLTSRQRKNIALAYCLHMQGREKEAQLIYTAALKQKPDDIGLVAIASNNIIAINRDQNVFDSKKKIKSATLEGLEHKLTSRQRKNIAVNHCLLALYTNQVI
ncbi:unnamed protein product, partial [Timema podura]|nr:unnamed protein product [Timema podura]